MHASKIGLCKSGCAMLSAIYTSSKIVPGATSCLRAQMTRLQSLQRPSTGQKSGLAN